MDQDDYNRQVTDINDWIDQLNSQYRLDRTANEDNYDEQAKRLNQQITEAEEQFFEYRNKGQAMINEVQNIESGIDNFNSHDFVFNSSKLNEQYQENLHKLETNLDGLKQELVDAKQEYDRTDQQLFNDLTTNSHKLEAKLEDLKDQHYSQDDGW